MTVPTDLITSYDVSMELKKVGLIQGRSFFRWSKLIVGDNETPGECDALTLQELLAMVFKLPSYARNEIGMRILTQFTDAFRAEEFYWQDFINEIAKFLIKYGYELREDFNLP